MQIEREVWQAINEYSESLSHLWPPFSLVLARQPGSGRAYSARPIQGIVTLYYYFWDRNRLNLFRVCKDDKEFHRATSKDLVKIWGRPRQYIFVEKLVLPWLSWVVPLERKNCIRKTSYGLKFSLNFVELEKGRGCYERLDLVVITETVLCRDCWTWDWTEYYTEYYTDACEVSWTWLFFVLSLVTTIATLVLVGFM